mmetsp:Transcript_49350/g.141907  ORF Transcript_49350/g.141907 Transcript_49350/m.141907 type:complete len:228 (-) Transcript_49350:501-1184(-)
MLCIARTMPMASCRKGRMAFTTRTRRKIRISRNIRASMSIFPRFCREPPTSSKSPASATPCHNARIHWSTTPLATMPRSRMFQLRSSVSVRKVQPRRRKRRANSQTKNSNMICSTTPQSPKLISVSKPMTTAFRMMIIPTTDWNKPDSTQARSDVNKRRRRRKYRRNRNALHNKRTGCMTRNTSNASWPPSCRSRLANMRSSTPNNTTMKSNQFQSTSRSPTKNPVL